MISQAAMGSQRPLRLFPVSRRCNGTLILWHVEVRASLTFLCVPKKSVILVKISAQSFIEICVCEPRPVTAVVRRLTSWTSRRSISAPQMRVRRLPSSPLERRQDKCSAGPVHQLYRGMSAFRPSTSKRERGCRTILGTRIVFTLYGPYCTSIAR